MAKTSAERFHGLREMRLKQRSVFGKICFMSSDSTRRKLDAKAYVAEFGAIRQGKIRFR